MFFSKGTPGFRGAIQIARLRGGYPIQQGSDEKIGTKRRLRISPLFSETNFTSEGAETRRVPIVVEEGSGNFSWVGAGHGSVPSGRCR